MTKSTSGEALHRDWHQAAQTLSEALPYILRYAGKTVLIKYGGHAMGEDHIAQRFARDIVLIKQVGVKPIVVHGGGPQIGQMLDRLGIKSSFIDGLRVTDSKTVEVVEMVLAGSINKQIVSAINNAGGKAIGLSGKDANLIQARKLQRTTRDPESNIERVLDLGFVGEPTAINPDVLHTISASDLIPVVAPIGIGAAGETYNINADTAAGAIAGAVGAMRLLMLTDVAGVLDENGKVIPHLSRDRALAMIKSGAIAGGMIPKVETCLEALDAGVGGVVILDGRVEHAVLLELFTEHGAGTLIS
ncbi:MAG: acetylglutamate kinase [Pseudomonadota bacterium]